MKFATLLALATAACADAGGPDRADDKSGSTNAPAPERFAPNTGTAPDYLVICIDQAQRRFAVAQDAVRLEDPVVAPDGVRTVEGIADRGASGLARFRCHFGADLSFREIEAL